MANTYELIVKTVDQSSRSLRNIDSSLQKVGRTAKTVGAALAGLAAGNIARGIVNQYREFEKYRTVLTTFLGSSQKANAELDRLQKLANSLPQDLQDITQAFTILQRNGIDTSSESLKAFSNIATANAKSFTQLGEAVADALTGEFERLKEFGIKVSRENDQFVARIGDQQVAVANSTTDLVRQLQRLGEEGGRFGGAAAANADTLDQSFSNLNGAIFETAVTIGEQLRPALKDVVDDTAALLRNNEKLVEQFGVGLGEAIKGTAEAIRFLARNFDLIRDAILAVAFTRLATSVANLGAKIGSFTANAKGFKGFFSGAGKAITAFALTIPRAIASLLGLSGAISTIANMHPIGRILTIGLGAAVAALAFARDHLIQIGNTQTTLTEILRAGWWKAGEMIQYVVESAGGWWTALKDRIVSIFQGDMAGSIYGFFDWFSRTTNKALNFIIQLYMAYHETVLEVYRNIPAAAAGAFDFMLNKGAQWFYGMSAWFKDLQAIFARLINFMVTKFAEFVAMTGSVFNKAAEMLGLDFSVDTMGIQAWASSFEASVIRAENAASGFREKAAGYAEAASNSFNDVNFDVDYGEIFDTDYLGNFASSISNYFGQIGASVEDLVLDYREYQAEEQKRINMEQIALESAQRFGDSVGGVSTAVQEQTDTITDNTQAIEGMLTKYQQATKAIKDFHTEQRDVSNGMKLLEADFVSGKYDLNEFKIGMEAMGAGMDDIQNRSIAMGVTLVDAFTDAGNSLAQGLARGIARGEGIMKSFKNFMQSILETILTQIIQQAFINPMIQSMTAGFSQAFSAFGMGGVGAFGMSGGGLLGGLFGGGGGLFGLLGGFLGFASGGVVPGMPTRGDSVPILATPGEVILNKRQQGEVLQAKRDEPLTVNFNLQAIDTQSGTEFILKNKKQITGVIQQAYNTRGQSGPLG